MKISELKDKQGNVNLDLVIIWDKATPQQKFGKTIKSVIVKDAESMQGDNSPSAYLDLYNEDAENYTVGDRIRVIDAYSKLIEGKDQFRITNTHKVEKLADAEKPKIDKKTTQELIGRFDEFLFELTEEFPPAIIDIDMLKKGIDESIESWKRAK